MSSDLVSYQVFQGSDAAQTRAFYSDLVKCGPVGCVAMNFFRAAKTSDRAKKYRGGIKGVGSYSDMAYERKQYSLKELSKILTRHAQELGIAWGWKIDQYANHPNSWVLYVFLKGFGQVSFHSPERHEGPDFPGEWDGKHVSTERILAFAESILDVGKDESKQIPLTQEALNV